MTDRSSSLERMLGVPVELEKLSAMKIRCRRESKHQRHEADKKHQVCVEKNLHEYAEAKQLGIVELAEVSAEKKPNRGNAVLDIVVEEKRWPTKSVVGIGVAGAQDAVQVRHEAKPDEHRKYEHGERNAEEDVNRLRL